MTTSTKEITKMGNKNSRKRLKKNKTGSRVQPRKWARKALKSLMVDSFKAHDLIMDTVDALDGATAEVAGRSDVAPELITKLKEFTPPHKATAREFIVKQDAIACEAEALLDQHTTPWKDLEEPLLLLQMQLQNGIDEMTMLIGKVMADAQELSDELPDTTPEWEEVTESELEPEQG